MYTIVIIENYIKDSKDQARAFFVKLIIGGFGGTAGFLASAFFGFEHYVKLTIFSLIVFILSAVLRLVTNAKKCGKKMDPTGPDRRR